MGMSDTLEQVLDATRFLSRLPLPEPRREAVSLATTLRAAPAAGLVIAAGPALLLVASSHAGLPALAAASLALTALLAVTGGLHEDGLADVADGFGGGASVTRKLAIMRDSRIGTYGTLAVGAALLLRVAALQGIVERAGAGHAGWGLLSAAVVSRGFMLLPLGLLRPARSDGLGRVAGPGGRLAAPLVASVVLGAILAMAAIGDRLQVMAGLIAAAAAAFAVTRLADHQIRGVTGDVIGATQQAVETTFLLALCAAGSR